MATPPTPTDADRVAATRVALAGIARNDPLDVVYGQLRRFLDYAFPFPADVLIEIAADALTLAGATRATPISLSNVYERYLPEWTVSGNTAHQKSRAAIDLAVATHAGIEPDYDSAAGWWRINDLPVHALHTTTIMIRLAAEQTDTLVAATCANIRVLTRTRTLNPPSLDARLP
jgi:hypothetical protein